jgi:hypothetical protein
MDSPLQVTFLGFTHTPDLDELIRQSAVTLEAEAGNHLTSCHVFVELAHQHHDETRVFHARIHLGLPGGVLAVNHEHHAEHSHEDAFIAVRDAFAAASRRVTDWRRRHGKG